MIPQIQDKINLLSKVTPARMFNYLKLTGSYIFSVATGKTIRKGSPLALAIEPTTSCNLRCPECPSGLRSFSRSTGMLSFDNYKKWIDQTEKHLLYLTLYFQGEPYLNRDLFRMIRYADEKNIYTATSTNGHFLGEKSAEETVRSGLDRLIISLDGITQETYKQYRVGGDINKVLEGVKNVVKWKKKLKSSTPYIVFQFLVVRPNEHEVPMVKEVARKLGVNDVNFKTAQIYNYKKDHPLIPENDKYSRYKKDENGEYQLKNKMVNRCWRMWHSPVISWDGQLVPCCFDKDAENSYGKLNGKEVNDLWKSEEADKFRKNVQKNRQQIDICKNCTEGGKVFL